MGFNRQSKRVLKESYLLLFEKFYLPASQNNLHFVKGASKYVSGILIIYAWVCVSPDCEVYLLVQCWFWVLSNPDKKRFDTQVHGIRQQEILVRCKTT